jgi:hypothetical protein
MKAARCSKELGLSRDEGRTFEPQERKTVCWAIPSRGQQWKITTLPSKYD